MHVDWTLVLSAVDMFLGESVCFVGKVGEEAVEATSPAGEPQPNPWANMEEMDGIFVKSTPSAFEICMMCGGVLEHGRLRLADVPMGPSPIWHCPDKIISNCDGTRPHCFYRAVPMLYCVLCLTRGVTQVTVCVY